MTDDQPENYSIKEIILRIEQKVDAVLNDHETRLRGLERWRYALPGGALVSAIGALTAVFVSFFHG